jgi:CDP-2,3-bis-(O-geranylgeranyl)-sn-glycerol synthase
MTGAVFGALALAGDLFSSFIKRRLGCTSGQSIAFLDQLPEALLPMFVLRRVLGLETWTIAGTAAVFTALDVLTRRLRP